ncbi:MAG: hypothetical protein AAGH76_06345 [Pseudomonadota bacterium]
MIVPEFWAEAKERLIDDGRARTYKRFGWSDESEDAALESAKERLAAAIAEAKRGKQVRLVDHKTAYNGAEGLPIREEIISRRGDSVITRNGYGAVCLNTPDVMFADVDLGNRDARPYGWVLFVVFFLLAVFSGVVENLGDNRMLLILAVVVAVLASIISKVIRVVLDLVSDDPADSSLARIESNADKFPNWILRIYRTQNGYRVLAMHDTFDPTRHAAQDFMKAIGGDPQYALMCRNQNCFRARLTPKPWRIGIDEHIRPRPGVWPIAAERMSERRRWIRRYETKAAGYAACRYVKTLGSGRTHRKCEDVRRLHDELCRATRELPIA